MSKKIRQRNGHERSAAGGQRMSEFETRKEPYKKLHLRNFFIYLFHELDYEVHQFVLQHLFGVKICDQEGYIVALEYFRLVKGREKGQSNLDGFSPENEEGFCSLGQESCELVYQDVLDFIRLLDLYADAGAVDARFNKNALIFVTGYNQRVEKDFRRAGSFNFRDIMSFGGLRCKIGQGESGRE